MKNAAAAGADTTALAHQVGKKLAVHIGALVSLAIVTLALWVLYHTLHEIRLQDVINSFNDLPAASILLAFLITVLSYFVVTGYDVLALHHLRRPLPYWRTALASFLASAFGNNVGFTMLTGGSIRYRIYSQAGLSAIEIAGVTTMCSLTTVMGMVFIFAVSLLFASGDVSDTALQLPPGVRRYVGFSIMAVIVGYLIVSALRPITFTTDNWSLRLPTAKTALAQGGLATLDLLLVGTLIYTLLPTHAGTDFISFLGIFALAMMAGSMSNVPGGIGVFETVLLLGLPEIPPAALLGSVLLFRCVYYLSPLSLAAILFAAYELVLRRARILRIHGAATDWLAEIGPQIMGVIIVFAGIVLLFSGAIPTYGERLRILHDSVPLGIVEIAHLVASAAGLGLIILARGISRRLSSAYGLSVLLLGLGIPAVLLKGLDYQEAVILATVLIVLLPTRREFQRHASLISQGFTVEWVSALTAILAVTVWLGLFNFKHLTYSHELWWQFAYDADLPRFLRAMFVVFGITGSVMLFNLFRADPVPEPPHDLDRVRRIVRKDPDTRANIALLGDKRLLFSHSGNAFIMYQVQGKSWVALGDPVGAPEKRSELLWAYRDLCDRYGGWPVFYLVDAAKLSLYVDLGLSLLKLGDEARVRLDEFSPLNVASAQLREVHRKVREQGMRFEMVRSTDVAPLLPELKGVSEAWLHEKQAHEQGFSKGYFDEGYIARLPLAVVRAGERIVAFAILWASRNKEELALDLMRYHPDAPAGVMDYLLVELMLGGKAQAYRWFNLGIAPLSNLDAHPLAPLWQRVGKLMYRQSEHFQNIESLRRYEENFKPVWRPKYLASPGGLNLPRILRDIGRLIAGGQRV